MSKGPTITVSMDKKCAECRKPGATESGICLGCLPKAMGNKPMRSPQGQAVRDQFRALMRKPA